VMVDIVLMKMNAQQEKQIAHRQGQEGIVSITTSTLQTPRKKLMKDTNAVATKQRVCETAQIVITMVQHPVLTSTNALMMKIITALRILTV